MINPFRRKKDLPRSGEDILTDVMASQFAKLILEDIKDQLPKIVANVIDAHEKNKSRKLDLIIDKVDGNQGVLNNILTEYKEQGDERVAHSTAIGNNNLLLEGLQKMIKNRTPYIENAAREGAKDGASVAVPEAMEKIVEPKKRTLQVVESKGFIKKLLRRG